MLKCRRDDQRRADGLTWFHERICSARDPYRYSAENQNEVAEASQRLPLANKVLYVGRHTRLTKLLSVVFQLGVEVHVQPFRVFQQ